MSISMKNVSEEKISEVAKELAPILFAGSVILLYGDLGAGKTAFTRHLLSFLGGRSRDVTSPTFTIVNEYEANLRVYHVDLFRLSDIEIEELPIEEYLESDGICVVEWAEKLGEHLPKEFLSIKLEFVDELNRNMEIDTKGIRYDRLLETRGDFFAKIQET